MKPTFAERILRRRRCPAPICKNADLRDCDLTEADLRGADLRGANLTNATFQKAVLHGADLRGASVDITLLSSVQRAGAILDDNAAAADSS